MASVQDDKGYNQGFKTTAALSIRTQRRCDYLLAKARPRKQDRMLELGCGTGELTFLLAQATEASVIGLDSCPSFIDRAKTNYQLPNLTFTVKDIQEGLGAESSYDCIVGNGILHHLFYTIDAQLEEISRVIRPKGRIVFLEPNIFNPYCFTIFRFPMFRRWARLDPDEMAFSRSFIHEKLKQHGFVNIDIEYRDFLLPNTPERFITCLVNLGAYLERMPLLRLWSQSLFISANRK